MNGFCFDKYKESTIDHFLSECRYSGDRSQKTTNGTIKINGLVLKYESRKIAIEDIANVFNVQEYDIQTWLKKNKKYYDNLFFADEIKRYADEKADKDNLPKDEHKRTNIKNPNSIMDRSKHYMDVRMIIPALCAINPKIANWVAYTIICSLACNHNIKGLDIIEFTENLFNNNNEALEMIKTEFDKQPKKFASDRPGRVARPQAKCKTLVVVIPEEMDPYMPSIKIIDVRQQGTCKYGKDTDQIKYFREFVTIYNKPGLAQEIVEFLAKNKVKATVVGGMMVRIGSMFTKDKYFNIRDKLQEYFGVPEPEEEDEEMEVETEKKPRKKSSVKKEVEMEEVDPELQPQIKSKTTSKKQSEDKSKKPTAKKSTEKASSTKSVKSSKKEEKEVPVKRGKKAAVKQQVVEEPEDDSEDEIVIRTAEEDSEEEINSDFDD